LANIEQFVSKNYQQFQKMGQAQGKNANQVAVNPEKTKTTKQVKFGDENDDRDNEINQDFEEQTKGMKKVQPENDNK
jgi:hypothetical protein